MLSFFRPTLRNCAWHVFSHITSEFGALVLTEPRVSISRSPPEAGIPFHLHMQSFMLQDRLALPVDLQAKLVTA